MINVPFGGRREAGFSLVELMIVVAIIGILSALAVPRFQNFQAKARQSEAKNNLSHIYTLQQSFYGDNDRYGQLGTHGNAAGTRNGLACNTSAQNEIGFRLTDCDKVRYDYKNTNNAVSFLRSRFASTASSAAGAANKVKPNCPAETWTINENKKLTVKNSVLTAVCD